MAEEKKNNNQVKPERTLDSVKKSFYSTKNEKKSESGKKDDNFKDFYSVKEKNKERRSCCSLPMLFIVLFLIFVFLVGGLWFIKNYSKTGFEYFKKTDTTQSENQSLFTRIDDDVKNYSDGEEIKIIITEKELEGYFGVKDAAFPLKRASLKIIPEGIEITGRTNDSFFSLPISIIAKPKAENGKFKIELDTVNSGFISLPDTIKSELNVYVDEVVNKKMSVVNNFEFTDIKVRKGEMELTGKKKAI